MQKYFKVGSDLIFACVIFPWTGFFRSAAWLACLGLAMKSYDNHFRYSLNKSRDDVNSYFKIEIENIIKILE